MIPLIDIIDSGPYLGDPVTSPRCKLNCDDIWNNPRSIVVDNKQFVQTAQEITTFSFKLNARQEKHSATTMMFNKVRNDDRLPS